MDKGHGQKEAVFQGVSKALDWAHPNIWVFVTSLTLVPRK